MTIKAFKSQQLLVGFLAISSGPTRQGQVLEWISLISNCSLYKFFNPIDLATILQESFGLKFVHLNDFQDKKVISNALWGTRGGFSVTEQAEQEKSHSLGLIWGVCAYWQKIEIYDKICVLTFLSASHIHLKTFGGQGKQGWVGIPPEAGLYL